MAVLNWTWLAGSHAAPPPATDTLTVSVVATTDLHGYAFPRGGHGGLALLGGYLRNLRAAREGQGGVVVVDAGDTYQGGVESNLSEGALVIEAFNALGVDAGAVGNHDFDFGAVDTSVAHESRDADRQGALKALAARAHFPLLAANLIDDSTGQPVIWPNVRPSTTRNVSGVAVGIVGVMTEGALRATLPLNVRGLRVAPLIPTIAAEATRLRHEGARIVVVAAHAGGGCSRFDDPRDLSSCDGGSEIFDVARALPHGLVDVIAAGHTHDGLAHIVNGIAIVQAYSWGRAFGRVDLVVGRDHGDVLDVRVFAPREICSRERTSAPGCDDAPASMRPRYEGREVEPDASVDAAMAPVLARVEALRERPLGVVLETPVSRTAGTESSLGNLFADALRATSAGADVALSNNGLGGLRADLPAGPLTFGRLYDVFPFDNRVTRVTVSAAALSEALARSIRRGRRGALGVSGVRVVVSCGADGLRVDLTRSSGQPIAPTDDLVVVAMDSLVSGSPFSLFPGSSPPSIEDAPLVRESIERWVVERGGVLTARDFLDADDRRWRAPEPVPDACLTP